jgi:hypothetical protein
MREKLVKLFSALTCLLVFVKKSPKFESPLAPSKMATSLKPTGREFQILIHRFNIKPTLVPVTHDEYNMLSIPVTHGYTRGYIIIHIYIYIYIIYTHI